MSVDIDWYWLALQSDIVDNFDPLERRWYLNVISKARRWSMNRESGGRGVGENENMESEQLSNDECPSCSIINDCDGNHRLSRNLNEDIVRNSSLNRVEASGFSRPVQL